MTNSKVALLYRTLQEEGYLYRTRIYDFQKINCSQNSVETLDDIEEHFDLTTDNEKNFIENDINYEFGKLSPIFEDFVMPTKSRVTAFNFFGGDTLTYS